MSEVVQMSDIQAYKKFIASLAGRSDIKDTAAHAKSILAVVDRRLNSLDWMKKASKERVAHYKSEKARFEAILRVEAYGGDEPTEKEG